MENIDDNLKCNNCKELPDKEIFQCSKQHWVCSNCVSEKCFVCNETLGDEPTRNEPFEKVLDSMVFACPWNELGCTQKLKRSEFRVHIQKTCSLSQDASPLCANIGYNCKYLSHPKNVRNVIEHFDKVHGCVTKKGQQVVVHLENFQSKLDALATKNGFWKPILLFHDDPYPITLGYDPIPVPREDYEQSISDGIVCLIICKMHPQDCTMSWHCILLNENPASLQRPFSIQHRESSFSLLQQSRSQSSYTPGNPEVNYFIKNIKNGENFNISWTNLAISIKQSENIIDIAPIRVPLSTLKNGFLIDRDLKVMMSINSSISKAEYYSNSRKLPTAVSQYEITTLGNRTFRKFLGVECSKCKEKLFANVLHICLQCSKMEKILCDDCMKNKKHENHVFAVIHDETERNRLKKYHTKIRKLLEDAKKNIQRSGSTSEIQGKEIGLTGDCASRATKPRF